MTITEFLTARYDEDQAAAESLWLPEELLNTVADTRRVLADIAAKRAILEVHDVAWNVSVCTVCHHLVQHGELLEQDPWPCKTVRLLALPYTDHPDYRQEWKP